MKVKLLTLSVLLISQFGYSQTKTIDQSNTRDGESVEYCLQHKKMAELIASDPAVAQTLANDELIRQQEELAASQGFQPKATTWYVPIVFHVLHNGGSENVSDEQIQDALNIVNRDYARLNADADNVHVDFQGMPTAADVVF
ncbi:MAG: M43 family zinc metalloprotease, partial [Flavobacteriales bacterium]